MSYVIHNKTFRRINMSLNGCTKPLSIAVIGAGPSGLFFCHAMEYMMKKTGKKCHVTCFEKSSQPGGIWRSARSSTPGCNSKQGDTNMYEQLWTNGASHLTEFFDYTFDEHFGRPVSVYMKRQDILEYILGRVQKNCPDFLEKYVQFQTAVEYVVYNDVQQKFNITLNHLDRGSQATEVLQFDKCIWACGDNGKQNVPESLVKLLREGGFPGRIIHSSNTASLEEDVRNKRILLIGGGLSAEDLALQAIKLQTQKVYVCTREDSEAEVSLMNRWPMDKVDVSLEVALAAVTEDGRCLQFNAVKWTPHGYELEGDEIVLEIRDIDTIIFVLDINLRRGFPATSCKLDVSLRVPNDWKMPPNILSQHIEDVPAHDIILYYKDFLHPNYYHGVLIDNPNIMFVTSYGSETPLLACDAHAWLFAGYLTNFIAMPTPQEMRNVVQAEALELLKVPMYRYCVDLNYFKAIDGLENFWPDDPDENTIWHDIENEHFRLQIRILARAMHLGCYPVDIGTFEQLNEIGEKIFQYGMLEFSHRTDLEPIGDEIHWKTFRDVDEPDQFTSIFTGSKAVALERPWMEL